MNRTELEQQYTTNGHGIITDLGKFEGEALYVPYFWDAYLDGFADDDDGSGITFEISDEDKAIWPELVGAYKLSLWERSDGFVECEVFWNSK